ncbi:LamG domain-containing protein, partial [Desulfosarcina sp.]|nr:LamG domain-containing protein [Desulfosarcina sp.]
TTQNITATITGSSDTEGDNIYNITDWRLNGTSIATLNLPFNTNISQVAETIRDYSTFENNGNFSTATTKAIWNSTCIVGGCYNFDGNDDYFRTDDPVDGSLDFGTEDFSLEAWFYLNSNGAYQGIIGKGANGGGGYSLTITNTNRLSADIQATSGGTNQHVECANSEVGTGSWHHGVAVYDRDNDIKLYLNGTLACSSGYDSGNEGSIDTTKDLAIGSYHDGILWNFNGSIDEVKIYDKALSFNQVQGLFNAGVAGTHLETIVSDETKVGDDWSVAVTPNDLTSDGATTVSENITIIILTNNQPTHSDPILNSTFATNLTTENLTCYNISTYDSEGDTVTNAYNWYINGTPLSIINLPFDKNVSAITADAVQDYSTYDNLGTLGGGVEANKPTWNDSCVVGGCYNFDGTNDIIKLDHDASIPGGIFNTSFAFTMEYWIYLNDDHGGPVDGSVRILTKRDTVLSSDRSWQVGFTSAGAANIPFLGLYNGTGGSGGYDDIVTNSSISINNWHHIAFVFDTNVGLDVYINGTKANYTNTLPIGYVVRDSTEPISIGAAIDVSSALNGSLDEVRIYNRSLSQEELLAHYNLEYNTIVSQETKVDDVWKCDVTPIESTNNGTTKISNELTILSTPANSTATVPSPIINSTDGLNTTSSTLNCSAIISDTEGDDLNVTVYWYENSTKKLETDYNNSWSSGTAFNATLASSYTNKDDTWHCAMNVTDGQGFDNEGNSTSMSIILGCGETLNSDTTLTQDYDCVGTAFTLGSGITLDCAGHYINGTTRSVDTNSQNGYLIKNCHFKTSGTGLFAEGSGNISNVNFTGGIGLDVPFTYIEWNGSSTLTNTEIRIQSDLHILVNEIVNISQTNSLLNSSGLGIKINEATDILYLDGLNIETNAVDDYGITFDGTGKVYLEDKQITITGPGAAVYDGIGGGYLYDGNFSGGIAVRSSANSYWNGTVELTNSKITIEQGAHIYVNEFLDIHQTNSLLNSSGEGISLDQATDELYWDGMAIETNAADDYGIQFMDTGKMYLGNKQIVLTGPGIAILDNGGGSYLYDGNFSGGIAYKTYGTGSWNGTVDLTNTKIIIEAGNRISVEEYLKIKQTNSLLNSSGEGFVIDAATDEL